MEAIETYDCSRCESKFCKECGEVKNKLCYDCVGWGSNELEERWEEEGWNETWDDSEPH